MSEPASFLYVATPCYGGMAHATYMSSLLALKAACVARGQRLKIELGGGDALISRARAGMMAKFLASPATHLLFIDADIGFTPEQVFRLLAANRPVVGGVYARKAAQGGATDGLEMDALPDSQDTPDDGFQRVAAIGAGFLLIAREAAERMDRSFPQLRAKLGDVRGVGVPDAAMVFEPLIDPVSRRYLADHQAFCHRWRQIGGDIWADRQSTLTHIGEVSLVGR